MFIDLNNLQCGLRVIVSKLGMTVYTNVYFNDIKVDLNEYSLTKNDAKRVGEALIQMAGPDV